MLSKSQVNFIKSLHQKKFRKQQGLFIVEGMKSVYDFLSSNFQLHSIYFTEEFTGSINKLPANIKLFEVNNAEMSKISALQNPQGILAVVHQMEYATPKLEDFQGTFSLILDGIRDPGNLGTIVRTADWFGIQHIICSEDTAEAYNPKTVQATMGSLSRVKIQYVNLGTFFQQFKLPVAGAFLEGENIYQAQWGDEGFIVLGNEGSGISDILKEHISKKVTIPQLGGAESLNVAMSAAIFCSELARTGALK